MQYQNCLPEGLLVAETFFEMLTALSLEISQKVLKSKKIILSKEKTTNFGSVLSHNNSRLCLETHQLFNQQSQRKLTKRRQSIPNYYILTLVRNTAVSSLAFSRGYAAINKQPSDPLNHCRIFFAEYYENSARPGFSI